MLLNTFWVVRDPTHLTESESEIRWETTMEKFHDYILGTIIADFRRENHRIHTDRQSAEIDAKMRIRCRDDVAKILARYKQEQQDL